MDLVVEVRQRARSQRVGGHCRARERDAAAAAQRGAAVDEQGGAAIGVADRDRTPIGNRAGEVEILPAHRVHAPAAQLL
jgi:hypothetical protein